MTERYNKIVTGFVVQSYVDGRCTEQEFIASDEVAYEDHNGEPIDVDLRAEKDQPLEMAVTMMRLAFVSMMDVCPRLAGSTHVTLTSRLQRTWSASVEPSLSCGGDANQPS